jgi:hypothetical protein
VAGRTRTARFDFGRKRPSAGGKRTSAVTLRLAKRARRSVASGARRATVETRAYQAYGHRSRFRLKASRP